MRRIEYGAAFRKDYKRAVKRGLDMTKFEAVASSLMNDEPLPQRHRPHMLSGEWKGFWECHISPDWLLIYDLENPEVLALHRMGTHADLFD